MNNRAQVLGAEEHMDNISQPGDFLQIAEEVCEEGCQLLFRGRLDIGWEKYEARHIFCQRRPPPQPLWTGQPLEGKSLLIWREQAVGDEIGFASCFPEIICEAKQCIITCDLRLQTLYRRSFPGAVFLGGLPGGEDHQRWQRMRVDYQVPAGNIYRYRRFDLSQFPKRRGFFVVDQDRYSYWKSRLSQLSAKPKVGISWLGGKRRDRTISPELWERILSIRDVTFVNLQYGNVRAALEIAKHDLGVEVHDFKELDLMHDLDDQAALISALDLIITVPNTTMHLAGAVGASVRLLFAHEWRNIWVYKGEQVPWYPSVRVYAKEPDELWGNVFSPIQQDLESLAAEPKLK